MSARELGRSVSTEPFETWWRAVTVNNWLPGPREAFEAGQRQGREEAATTLEQMQQYNQHEFNRGLCAGAEAIRALSTEAQPE